MMKQLTIADRILITVIMAAVLASFYAVASVGTHGATVFIEVNGKTVHKANLSEPHIIKITGARGELVVETRDGQVAVIHAECPNHICVRTGWRSRSGDVIVCVPNKTLVRVAGDLPEGVQAVTE